LDDETALGIGRNEYQIIDLDIFTVGRNLFNIMFSFEGITFGHFGTDAYHLRRQSPLGLPGTLVYGMSHHSLINSVGNSTVRQFVNTPNQINTPFVFIDLKGLSHYPCSDNNHSGIQIMLNGVSQILIQVRLDEPLQIISRHLFDLQALMLPERHSTIKHRFA